MGTFDFNDKPSTLEENKLILSKFVAEQDNADPVFLVDLGEIVRKYENWQRELPRIKPFYAVKCNNNLVVLKTLVNLNVGFDCASKKEISTMLSLGASADDIVYANPCKQSSHISYARDNDVKRMTFDNANELYKIKDLYPNAELLLRILTDDKHALCQLGIKFGAHPKNWRQLLHTAQKLNLNVVGVSFHVGSGCYNAEAFDDAVRRAKSVFTMGVEMGMNFNVLDVGGGFPGTDDSVISFYSITQVLNQALDVYFPENGNEDLKIIAEPGRFFVASSHTLAVNVIAKRTVTTGSVGSHEGSDDIISTADSGICSNEINELKDDEHSYMYYVNDGVYGSFNALVFEHATFTPIALCDSNGERVEEVYRNCSIWGPTCDSIDCINKMVSIPELQVGDWIMYPNMGAYSTCAASTFNGFALTKAVYIDSSHKDIGKTQNDSDVTTLSCHYHQHQYQHQHEQHQPHQPQPPPLQHYHHHHHAKVKAIEQVKSLFHKMNIGKSPIEVAGC